MLKYGVVGILVYAIANGAVSGNESIECDGSMIPLNTCRRCLLANEEGIRGETEAYRGGQRGISWKWVPFLW